MNEREMLRQLVDAQKRISELYVVIDTLQTNLRSAMSEVPDVDKIMTQSFKWGINWKPGDENE